MSRVLGSGVESLEKRELFSAEGLATQLIYELNRARHDPISYASERGLSLGGSPIESRPPLAIRSELMNISARHASEMSLRNYLAHQSSFDGRWPNQRARDANYGIPSDWPGEANFMEAIAGGSGLGEPRAVIDQWLVDAIDPSKRNRSLIFGTSTPFDRFREIGAGYAYREESDLDHYWSLNAAYEAIGDLFLTGIVYRDANGDGAYDAGEGLANIRIQSGPLETVTSTEGAWSMKVAGGRHEVVASGASLSKPMRTVVFVGTDNIEIDFQADRWAEVNFKPRGRWTNPNVAEDINADGEVTPLDALVAINLLNERGIHELPEIGSEGGPPPYYDCNGDGLLSPIDALIVINRLNNRK